MIGTCILFVALLCVCVVMGVVMARIKGKMKPVGGEQLYSEASANRKFYRKIYTIFSAIFFVSVAIALVLLLNLLFVVFEKCHLTVVSPLSYTETLIMLVSLLATVAIAFFQYQVQLQLEEEHWLIEEENRRGHYEELCSERLKSLGALHTLRGYAVNFNLPEAYIYHNERGNSAYHIVVGDKNKTDQALFLQPYFEKTSQNIECECEGKKLQMHGNVTPNYLTLDLDDNEQKAKEFFVSACSIDESIRGRARLKVSVQLTVKDHSISPGINFDYGLMFYICPAQTGYHKDGMFLLELEEVYMVMGHFEGDINCNKGKKTT